MEEQAVGSAEPSGRAAHWAGVYRSADPEQVSWFQPEPVVSLDLLDELAVDPGVPVVDVGGGASFLVDRLVDRGFADVTVLDVADGALDVGRWRLPGNAPVSWVVRDVVDWEPDRRYGLWHDRAVLHFLTGAEVRAYRRVMDAALLPGGAVILATFAPDGPLRCSGLAVTRYSAGDLAGLLGPAYRVLAERQELHVTPGGGEQSFTWVAARRR